MGDEADLVVALNDQVPYARIKQKAYRKGTTLIIESKWANHNSEFIRNQYSSALADFKERGFNIVEVNMEEELLNK